jgi:16S rRNA U516 pseudouridylate synthase RsuA-like enzyme
LDADSSGLLLFSSDGGITQALLSPRTQVEREYLATVVGNVDEGRLRAALRGGIETSEGSFTADLLSSHILEVDALNTALELVRGSQRERYDKMVLKHKSSPGTSSSQSVTASSSSGAYSKVSKPKISLSGLDSSMLTKPAPEDLSDKVDLSSFDAFLTCQGLTSASLVRLVVREGKYRMVRRMLHNAGHSVVALHRTRYGDVVLGDLPENQLRPIFPDELKWAREAAAKYRKVMRSEGREGKSDSKKNFIPMIAVSNNVNDV